MTPYVPSELPGSHVLHRQLLSILHHALKYGSEQLKRFKGITTLCSNTHKHTLSLILPHTALRAHFIKIEKLVD